jgi:hypothetical protein
MYVRILLKCSHVAFNFVINSYCLIQNDFCNANFRYLATFLVQSIGHLQPLTITEQREEKRENNRFPERYFSLQS